MIVILCCCDTSVHMCTLRTWVQTLCFTRADCVSRLAALHACMYAGRAGEGSSGPLPARTCTSQHAEQGLRAGPLEEDARVALPMTWRACAAAGASMG